MEIYRNRSGNSGIKAYELMQDGVKVQFADGSVYLYDNKTNGARSIRIMKKLASDGIGLTTYINQKIRKNFAHKVE